LTLKVINIILILYTRIANADSGDHPPPEIYVRFISISFYLILRSSGLDIEEMSNAGSDISSTTSGPPTYTVTSPPPTTKKSGNFSEVTATHTVKPTSDYSAAAKRKKSKEVFNEEADCTVLLKLKEGDEYKLVLNMQQYSPDDITVKLNDRELTILAHEGNTEDFTQRHTIPEGIDLDQLTSSFSADGILVIKAPRLKAKSYKK
jgi:HSP20 family molecular chaperone IbpA